MAESRRMSVLQGHLAPAGPSLGAPALGMHPTAAQEQEQPSYSVVLPEKLTESGPWLVRR